MIMMMVMMMMMVVVMVMMVVTGHKSCSQMVGQGKKSRYIHTYV